MDPGFSYFGGSRSPLHLCYTPPIVRSLYVHFPFCEAKCHYCDFYSLGRERTRPGDADAFEKALRVEAEQMAPRLSSELDTIFFGGGTPSMTPPESMEKALEPLWKHTRVTSATEWTMEANPSSIALEPMKKYRAFGVNRISMGVQSFDDNELRFLGRRHDSLQARDAGVREARTACSDEDLQLLDDTVAIRSLRFARDDGGRLRLQRVYGFEYSDTGDNRREGSVTLLGHDVVMVSLRARLTLVGGGRHEQH